MPRPGEDLSFSHVGTMTLESGANSDEGQEVEMEKRSMDLDYGLGLIPAFHSVAVVESRGLSQLDLLRHFSRPFVYAASRTRVRSGGPKQIGHGASHGNLWNSDKEQLEQPSTMQTLVFYFSTQQSNVTYNRAV